MPLNPDGAAASTNLPSRSDFAASPDGARLVSVATRIGGTVTFQLEGCGFDGAGRTPIGAALPTLTAPVWAPAP